MTVGEAFADILPEEARAALLDQMNQKPGKWGIDQKKAIKDLKPSQWLTTLTMTHRTNPDAEIEPPEDAPLTFRETASQIGFTWQEIAKGGLGDRTGFGIFVRLLCRGGANNNEALLVTAGGGRHLVGKEKPATEYSPEEVLALLENEKNYRDQTVPGWREKLRQPKTTEPKTTY